MRSGWMVQRTGHWKTSGHWTPGAEAKNLSTRLSKSSIKEESFLSAAVAVVTAVAISFQALATLGKWLQKTQLLIQCRLGLESLTGFADPQFPRSLTLENDFICLFFFSFLKFFF